MKLNIESARSFNSSLKKAISEKIGQKVKVEIINSYKFPHCWVRVHAETEFPNDFRLNIFDACNKDRSGLFDEANVIYGNIQSRSISAHVPDWQKMFETD